jgi:hypothetical protein
MNSWFSKFKVAPSSSDENNISEKCLRSVDETLRRQPPSFDAPPDLHFAIMNEVRQAARTTTTSVRRRTSTSLLRWYPAPAFAALTLAVIWWLLDHRGTRSVPHPVNNQIALMEVGSALEVGVNATRDIPPVVVGPLSDELDRMNTDLKNAGGFLLSSLP